MYDRHRLEKFHFSINELKDRKSLSIINYTKYMLQFLLKYKKHESPELIQTIVCEYFKPS